MPQHQVVLAFNADEDAELFEEWWQRDGLALYTQWVNGLRQVHHTCDLCGAPLTPGRCSENCERDE